MDYDRRASTVIDLETTLLAWHRNAAPSFQKNMLAQARLDPRFLQSRADIQPNLVIFHIKGKTPLDKHDPRGPSIGVNLEVEWYIAASAQEVAITADFEGGGRAHKSFKFPMSAEPGDQGGEVGRWLAGLEPVAPPEG